MTYSPDRVIDDSQGDSIRPDRRRARTHHDGLEGAVSYKGKFGDVGFGDRRRHDGLPGPQLTAAPATLTRATGLWLAASISAAVSVCRLPTSGVTNEDSELQQSQLTDAGVRYVTGANQFSLVGSVGEMDNTGDSYIRPILGSYARTLGPGVKVHMNLFWNESDDGRGIQR